MNTFRRVSAALGALAIAIQLGCQSPTDVDAVRKKKYPVLKEDLASVEFSHTLMQFSATRVQASDKRELVLSNTSSTDTVIIKSLRLADGENFVVSIRGVNPPFRLEPYERTNDGRKNITLEFYPQRPGFFRDTLYVNESSRFFVVLTGRGLDTGEVPFVKVKPYDKDIDFGEVKVNERKELHFSIANLSTDPVTITDIIPSGPGSGFSHKWTLPVRLEQSSSGSYSEKSIVMEFLPTRIGSYDGPLKVQLLGIPEPVEIGYIKARGIKKD